MKVKKWLWNKLWRNVLYLNSTEKIKIKGKCRAETVIHQIFTCVYIYIYICFNQRSQCLTVFNGTFVCVKMEEQSSVSSWLCALSAISSPQIFTPSCGRTPVSQSSWARVGWECSPLCGTTSVKIPALLKSVVGWWVSSPRDETTLATAWAAFGLVSITCQPQNQAGGSRAEAEWTQSGSILQWLLFPPHNLSADSCMKVSVAGLSSTTTPRWVFPSKICWTPAPTTQVPCPSAQSTTSHSTEALPCKHP